MRTRHLGLALTLSVACTRESYRQPVQTPDGRVRVETSRGRVVSVSPDSDQVGVDQLSLAPDNRIVGWLALYPNCCTSYPVPLKLLLLPLGRRQVVVDDGLPIWQWAFVDGGRRVVLRQAPVHGAAPIHYALHDAITGRLIASADVDQNGSQAPPTWARAVMAHPPGYND